MKTAQLFMCATTLVGIGMADSVSAAWVRLPSDTSRPVNQAAKWMPETALESSSGIQQATNLLADSPTELARLGTGKAEAVIRLGGQQVLDTIYFNNAGAAGVVTISGSTNKGEWIFLARKSFSSVDSDIFLRFAAAQVRYVRLGFELSSAGGIASVAITGSGEAPAANAERAASKAGGKMVSVNLLSASGGARPVYAHPTPANLGEEEYKHNIFAFPASNETYRTVVFDLGVERKLNQYAVSYSRIPTRVSVYAFDQLPEKKDWRGKLALDSSLFDNVSPVGVASDATGTGRVNIKFNQPTSSRYLAVRFEPNFVTASHGIDKMIKGLATQFGLAHAQPIAASGPFNTGSSSLPSQISENELETESGDTENSETEEKKEEEEKKEDEEEKKEEGEITSEVPGMLPPGTPTFSDPRMFSSAGGGGGGGGGAGGGADDDGTDSGEDDTDVDDLSQ